jgi:hypothetical protein
LKTKQKTTTFTWNEERFKRWQAIYAIGLGIAIVLWVICCDHAFWVYPFSAFLAGVLYRSLTADLSAKQVVEYIRAALVITMVPALVGVIQLVAHVWTEGTFPNGEEISLFIGLILVIFLIFYLMIFNLSSLAGITRQLT